MEKPSQLYWRKQAEAAVAEAKKFKQNTKWNAYEDIHNVIPERLRERVERVFKYKYKDEDKNAFIVESSDKDANSLLPDLQETEDDQDEFAKMAKAAKKPKVASFHESTCTDVKRLDHAFPRFKLHVGGKRTKSVVKPPPPPNWEAAYLSKHRAERVNWDTKVYDMEVPFDEKPIDVQAELLMDAALESFSEWLDKLDGKTTLTKDKLTSMFAIESDRKLMAAIHIEPREVNAIAQEVANTWHVPEMAIELKYMKYNNELLAMSKQKPKPTMAFGTNIKIEDRNWIPDTRHKKIETKWPEQLRSGQRIFKGISHLRSVSKLVGFLNDNPTIEKPKYLVDCGLFAKKEDQRAKKELPLYEQLKLKY